MFLQIYCSVFYSLSSFLLSLLFPSFHWQPLWQHKEIKENTLFSLSFTYVCWEHHSASAEALSQRWPCPVTYGGKRQSCIQNIKDDHSYCWYKENILILFLEISWRIPSDEPHQFWESWKVFLTDPASCSNSLLRPFSSSVSSSGGLGMGGCWKWYRLSTSRVESLTEQAIYYQWLIYLW